MPTEFREVVYSPITSISKENGVGFQFLGHCRRLSAEVLIADTLPETAMLMMWLVEGEVDVQVAGGVHHCSAGDALLLSPRSTYDVSIQNTPVSYWWGVMHGPALPGMLEESGLETGTICGLSPPEYQIRPLMDDMRAATLTENMKRHQAQRVAQFLHVATEHVRTQVDDPILARATATIERNLGDPYLNAQSIAKLVGIHRRSLPRLFQEVYGQTASDYIMEKRLQKRLSATSRYDAKGFRGGRAVWLQTSQQLLPNLPPSCRPFAHCLPRVGQPATAQGGFFGRKRLCVVAIRGYAYRKLHRNLIPKKAGRPKKEKN
jgi:AraC-like DNA-binding protein